MVKTTKATQRKSRVIRCGRLRITIGSGGGHCSGGAAGGGHACGQGDDVSDSSYLGELLKLPTYLAAGGMTGRHHRYKSPLVWYTKQ